MEESIWCAIFHELQVNFDGIRAFFHGPINRFEVVGHVSNVVKTFTWEYTDIQYKYIAKSCKKVTKKYE